MKPVSILDNTQLELTVTRLAHELIENHDDFTESVLIGIQPRGVYLLRRLTNTLEKILSHSIPSGELDVTFYRDDFRRRDAPLTASTTDMNVLIEDKKVVLVDDVLFSGRTIRSGLDALQAFGRPRKVELLVLIDRRFKRELPIQADYVGKYVDSIESERISVQWKEQDGKDKVLLFTPEERHG